MLKKPVRQNPLLLPLIWGGSFLMTRAGRLSITKKNLENVKPPYLILAQHQGFTDYYILPLALFPRRANYVSDVEGFAAFGDTLYRQIGCIPTRRFTNDISLIYNILHVTQKQQNSVVIFPEARHSNVGTASEIPDSVGKLAKLLGLPVVLLKTHGSYLTSPIWDEEHQRKVPLSASLELLLRPGQLTALTTREVTLMLNKGLKYDEYRWQFENRIPITYPQRAEGLHKVLYQCPSCHREDSMKSRLHTINCTACKSRWDMDEYGRLHEEKGNTRFEHIPDWYEWQRHETNIQIDSGHYRLSEAVTIEALPNQKGFVSLGKGTLLHNQEGFSLTIAESGKSLYFAGTSMFSVHTEYNYKGRGDCIVLSDKDCCYYLYFHNDNIKVTKIQFAAEYIHRLAVTGNNSKAGNFS